MKQNLTTRKRNRCSRNYSLNNKKWSSFEGTESIFAAEVKNFNVLFLEYIYNMPRSVLNNPAPNSERSIFLTGSEGTILLLRVFDKLY